MDARGRPCAHPSTVAGPSFPSEVLECWGHRVEVAADGLQEQAFYLDLATDCEKVGFIPSES
jgi:hypothetical protein